MRKLLLIIIIIFFSNAIYAQKKKSSEIKKIEVKHFITPKYSNFYLTQTVRLNVSSIVYNYNDDNTDSYEKQYMLKKFSIQIEGKIEYEGNVLLSGNEIHDKKLYINFDTLEEMKYYQDIFEGGKYSKVTLKIKFIEESTTHTIMNVKVEM